MKVLITGAKGQLGTAFQREFEKRAISFAGTDVDTCDIANPQSVSALLEQHRPSVLINCAAFNQVEAAEENSQTAYAVNAQAVTILGLACKERGIKLVHYGSDYVFDGHKYDLYVEGDTPRPLNIYGASKLEGESQALAICSDALVLRTSWVFGDGQQNFLYKLGQWAQKNRVLRISADEVSVPTSTVDLVDMTLKALERGLSGLYHAVNSGYASRYELAKFYLKASGMDALVVPVAMAQFPSKVSRPLFSAMSNQKLSSALEASVPQWQEGVERFITSKGR